MSNRSIEVKVNGIEVVVSNPRFSDKAIRRALSSKMAEFLPRDAEGKILTDVYTESIDSQMWDVAAAISQSKAKSGIVFPQPTDPAEVVYRFFQSMDEIDQDFVEQWMAAASSLRQPAGGDPLLSPALQGSPDPQSSGGESNTEAPS